MRHQTVRPLSALVTIFVVVLVFGLVVSVAQPVEAGDGPSVEAEADRGGASERVILTSGSHPID